MEIIEVELSKLKESAYNPRFMNQDDMNNLEDSIKEFGFVEPVVINKDYEIIGGHQRFYACRTLGLKNVPCVIVDLNDKNKEKLLNLALNKIHGEWDIPKLYNLIEELKIENVDINLSGFDMDELNKVFKDLPQIKDKEKDDEELVNRLLENPPESIVKTGDIWQLGNHRLMCGDATKIEDVKRLMDGKKADMVLTDPPYGTTACSWDSVIPFEPMWEQLKRITKKNGAIVLFGSQPFTSALVMSNPKMFKYEWVWEKERPSNIFLLKKQPGRCHENIVVFGGSAYNPQMEASISGNKKERSGHNKVEIVGGKVAKYDKDWDGSKRYSRSVLKINRDKDKLHPTQKPVALMEYLIKTYTQEGETVLDFCAGSGTTAIAAEELNRICYMMEIDEHYCDVIINRWEGFTNRKAVKL